MSRSHDEMHLGYSVNAIQYRLGIYLFSFKNELWMLITYQIWFTSLVMPLPHQTAKQSCFHSRLHCRNCSYVATSICPHYCLILHQLGFADNMSRTCYLYSRQLISPGFLCSSVAYIYPSLWSKCTSEPNAPFSSLHYMCHIIMLYVMGPNVS